MKGYFVHQRIVFASKIGGKSIENDYQRKEKNPIP